MNNKLLNKVKIVCIQSVLTDHIVKTVSKIGSVILIHGHRGIIRIKLTNIKTLKHFTTYFGMYWLFSLLFKKIETHVPSYFVKLSNTLNNESPNIILVSEIFEWTTWQCIHYVKKHNHNTKLYIFSETRNWPQSRFSRVMLYLFVKAIQCNQKYITKLIVWTKQGEEWFTDNLPELSVLFLPAPIDIALFYPDDNKQYVSGGVLRIIMNARYIPLKEHRTFFQALALLEQRGIKYSASLIGRDGHLESELKEYAKEISIAKYLTWLEPVSMVSLQTIYSTHDVLVLPSYREAIGMVVPEAMACGLATVTSEVVGANTYVEVGKTGLIFETGNAEALADALEQLSEVSIVESYGKAGAKVIREQYSTEVLGQKLLNTLE